MAQRHEKEEKQQKRWHSSGTSDDLQSVPALPPEIIVEILLRLTVESLLRCRSVCKLWCSIISDPHFVESHLSLSTSGNDYAHHRLIFCTKTTSSLRSCPLYDVLYDGSVNDLKHDYPLNHVHKSVWIIGSCNGLICITIDDSYLLILNPSTRKSKRLPLCCSKDPYNWYYGFGYDESTLDYKVVGISCIFKDGAMYDMSVNIYSLKNENWKKIDDFHNGCTSDLTVKFLNGAFHWAATRYNGSYYSWTIVSLDLAKETYGEILQPVYDEGDYDLKLGALGEWLCVLCEYRRSHADLWVMKVYGDKDSWSKFLSIPYVTDPWWDQFSAPLCISNDGKVLLQLGSKLLVYDSKKYSSSQILNYRNGLEVDTFVESLVSPHSPSGIGDNN